MRRRQPAVFADGSCSCFQDLSHGCDEFAPAIAHQYGNEFAQIAGFQPLRFTCSLLPVFDQFSGECALRIRLGFRHRACGDCGITDRLRLYNRGLREYSVHFGVEPFHRSLVPRHRCNLLVGGGDKVALVTPGRCGWSVVSKDTPSRLSLQFDQSGLDVNCHPGSTTQFQRRLQIRQREKRVAAVQKADEPKGAHFPGEFLK